MGAQGLCLPAAKETIGTWIGGFGFGAMPFEREAACRKELHILVFPGTRLLVRDFKEVSIETLQDRGASIGLSCLCWAPEPPSSPLADLLTHCHVRSHHR